MPKVSSFHWLMSTHCPKTAVHAQGTACPAGFWVRFWAAEPGQGLSQTPGQPGRQQQMWLLAWGLPQPQSNRSHSGMPPQSSDLGGLPKIMAPARVAAVSHGQFNQSFAPFQTVLCTAEQTELQPEYPLALACSGMV